MGMPTGPRAFLEPARCVWAITSHDDCDKSSGFERGSKSLKMSSCDFKKVVCEFRDGVLGDGSSIVAFENQPGGRVSECYVMKNIKWQSEKWLSFFKN